MLRSTDPAPAVPPPTQREPASLAASACDRGEWTLRSLDSLLLSGFSIVHVRSMTTPAQRSLRLEGQGAYGRALILERSHFEATPVRSCGWAMDGQRSLRLNRPTIQRHERLDGTWDVLDADPLRGGPTGARIEARDEALLIVTPDAQAPGEWLVLGALELRDGAITAPVYGLSAGSDAARVIAACEAHRTTLRGVR